MKQNQTDYHLLFLSVKEADDYFPAKDRTEILKLIKELYLKNEKLLKEEDDNGKYGIRYTTIHDDSKWLDTHEQFFSTKKRRDAVYDDWSKEMYWDKIFELNLTYPLPNPNFGNIEKVFKESGSIYTEQLKANEKSNNNGINQLSH